MDDINAIFNSDFRAGRVAEIFVMDFSNINSNVCCCYSVIVAGVNVILAIQAKVYQ